MIHRIDFPPRVDISITAGRLWNEGAELEDIIEVYLHGVLIRAVLLGFILDRPVLV